MTVEQYLYQIITQRKAPIIRLHDRRLTDVTTALKKWAGSSLSNLKQSGSSAKGTALKGVADFDIFISLKSSTSETLKDIYNKLDRYITGAGWKTRRQNVSLGITHNNLKIDLVPGRIQSGYHNFHSIYSSKQDTWMKTNIAQHINTVKTSGRVNEILLTKIWREINKLDFPSIYLELTVLNALRNKPINNLSNNFLTVLEYLRDYFVQARVIDPANTNNKISDSLYKYEKEKIALQAKVSLTKSCLEDIIY